MKIKKVLVLFAIVFFALIISNNVFAVIPEGMSEEFKSILNEEGQFVITDTANNEDKNQILINAVNKYATNEYGFQAYFINAENTKCRIQRHEVNPYNVLESYDVEVKFEEKFSDEFKKITDDGNIIITSSSANGKESLLFEYCNFFRNDNFSFNITDLDEDMTAATLQMYKNEGSQYKMAEQHLVKIKYEEKFSEEFKKLTDDGNIVIRASRDNGKNGLIYSYCSAFSNEDRYFTAMDINENGTLCTIQMYEYNAVGNTMFSTIREQHMVKIQYDKTMSENFKKHLNENGKFVINSIKPENSNEWLFMFEILFYNRGIMADFEYLAEDLSSCEITIEDSSGIPEIHKVEFEYNYDKNIKEFVEKITKEIPKGEPYFFKVKDMELINYWLNSEDESGKEGASNFDNYSGELKSFVDYKNFNLLIDNRLGADVQFFTLRGGVGLLQHKGTTYYINDLMGTLGNHILYVPDNTGSTKEALVEAVQKRVDEYAGKGKVKITAGEGTVLEYYEKDYNNRIIELQKMIDIEKAKEKPNQRLIEDYETRKYWAQEEYERFLEDYNNPNGENYFLQSAEGDFWFTATINGMEHKFIVIKDSKSMINPKHKTKDFKTDVEISTDSKNIPLDTIIEAEKITEGKEYERIIKILDVEENITFDLNLFSKSLDNYIRKLENENFEVRIPVAENLKNKELAVYYVDENGKIEKYEVDIQDGYAVFETNHFSTYTLAEEKDENNANNNDRENVNTDSTTNDSNIGNDTNKQNNSTNPSTGDNIIFFIGILIISILGIIITKKCRQEYKNK